MRGSPQFTYPFDPARVFLTDVNGDGLEDLVYAGYDEVTYWINQSGMSFAPPQVVRFTPPSPRPDTMRVADMTGNGQAGLLWTSPSTDYRYLDFAGGAKAGLLRRIDNNLGRVTTVKYTTSTEQAQADRTSGRPWRSFLPFPVQVVEAVEVHDTHGGMHSRTQYRYHDGTWDGDRREFDGFATADVIETGDETMPTALTTYAFHTAATVHPLNPDPELQRTLKRKLHRIEVFGLDGSAVEDVPFRVEKSDWHVRIEEVLPGGKRVVFPHVHQTTTTTSERGPDARVERRTYEFDLAGNVVSERRRAPATAPRYS